MGKKRTSSETFGNNSRTYRGTGGHLGYRKGWKVKAHARCMTSGKKQMVTIRSGNGNLRFGFWPETKERKVSRSPKSFSAGR